ncbi:hypothetical protein EWB00_001360, partial [Schistosoma japonicum]
AGYKFTPLTALALVSRCLLSPVTAETSKSFEQASCSALHHRAFLKPMLIACSSHEGLSVKDSLEVLALRRRSGLALEGLCVVAPSTQL